MLTKMNTPLFAALIGLMVVGGTVAGCDNDGPLENAGERADEAVNDAKRAVKDAVD